mmetsp:Transcript_144480/g.448591  ORF Transcript_144480/g.448591 Transcript_144480/m.448591 type:complete len:208 (+) Transcript_144480:1047-1670(+)
MQTSVAVAISPAHHDLVRVSCVRKTMRCSTRVRTMSMSSSRFSKLSESMKTLQLAVFCRRIFSSRACAAACALWWQMKNWNSFLFLPRKYSTVLREIMTKALHSAANRRTLQTYAIIVCVASAESSSLGTKKLAQQMKMRNNKVMLASRKFASRTRQGKTRHRTQSRLPIMKVIRITCTTPLGSSGMSGTATLRSVKTKAYQKASVL